MTVSSFYNGLISNMFMGGIAAILIIAAMFWKANKIAATGNRGKMFSWSVAPAIMVIAAVIAHGVALNVIWPKIQGAFTSTPVQNLVSTGGALATAADSVLWGNGNGEMMASYAGSEAFKAPLQSASYGQPGTQSASGEPIVDSVNAPVAAPANAPFQPLFGQPQPVAVPTLAPLQKVNMVGTTVTVLPGDSLAAIAKRAYGTTDGWRDIYAANQAVIGSNPNAIYAGMQLVIPAMGSQSGAQLIAVNAAAPAAPAQAPAAIASDGRVYYDVAIPTPQPAQLAVEAYQGHLQRVPVSAPAVVAPVVAQPTPTRIVIAPTPAPIMVVAVKPGLDLGRPSVDTSAPGLGAGSSTSGTTVTVGN